MKPVSEYDLSTVDLLAATLSKHDGRVVGNAQFAETLRRVASAVREYQRVSPAEERAAWDAYFAAALRDGARYSEASTVADRALAFRRERFGSPERPASLADAIASEPRR